MTGLARAAVMSVLLAAACCGPAAHAQTRPGNCAVALDETGSCPTKYQYRAYAGEQPAESRAQKLARLVLANVDGLAQCREVASSLASKGGFALRPQHKKDAMGIKDHARQIAREMEKDPQAFMDRLDQLYGYYGVGQSFKNLIDEIGGWENFALNASGVNAPQAKGLKACEAHLPDFAEYAQCAGKLGRHAKEAARQADLTVAYFDETAAVQCFRASGQVVGGMR